MWGNVNLFGFGILLEQIGLEFGEFPGHFDEDLHVLVAAASGSQRRKSVSLESYHISVLRTGRYAYFLRTGERGHLYFASQCSLGECNGSLADQIVCVSNQHGMGFDSHITVKVPACGSVWSRSTLSAYAYHLSVANTGWYFYGKKSFLAGAS